jgi:transcriptional antiterminator NusG
MLGGIPGKDEKSVPDVAPFEKGDRVTVKDGIFAGMEGEVKDVLEAKGQVRVELTIFGRPTSVELEYWQIEQL